MVLGAARDCCRGFRNVSRRCRMPRFLYPSDARLDPALVLFAQLGLADFKDLARPDSEFANLLCHHRRHVHDPIAFERVHDLFAIASFDAFAIVPAEGNLDWRVGVESQNSIRHFVLLVLLSGGPVLSLLLQVHRLPPNKQFYFPFLFWLVVVASGLAVCPDRRKRSTRDSSMRTRLWTRWWSAGPRIGNGCSKTLSADS